MKYFHFVLLLSIAIFMSCRRDPYLHSSIERMTSVPVDLCLDSMSCIMSGAEIAFVNDYQADKVLNLCIYMDSSFCVPCNLRVLCQWQNYIDSVNRQIKETLVPIFIFSPSEKQLQEDGYMNLLKKMRYEYPLFVDTTDVFRRMNPQIPTSPIFHTFLLDNMGNVILVGNPLKNEKVETLMKNLLSERLGRKSPQSSDAVEGLSNKRTDVVQRK